MKRTIFYFSLIIFSIQFPNLSILNRRVKLANFPSYSVTVEKFLGRELSKEEEREFLGVVEELREALGIKEAEENLNFLFEVVGEKSRGDFPLFLRNLKLFLSLIECFPTEAVISRTFKDVVRTTVGESPSSEALEENIQAVCEICLFLKESNYDFNQIRDICYLARQQKKSPQDYKLNLQCFLKVYEIISEETFALISPEKRPEPLDYIKGFLFLSWNIFEDPNFYRQMLLGFTDILAIFLKRTELSYREKGKEIRNFYYKLGPKVAAVLKEFGEGVTPFQVRDVLRPITYLSATILNADKKISFEKLYSVMEELIEVAKDMAIIEYIGRTEDVGLFYRVRSFKALLSESGIELIVPLLGELGVDVGKEIVYISCIVKEVSVIGPKLTKGEVQQFKDCLKAIRDLLQAIKEAGYRGEQVVYILREFEEFRKRALEKEYPAYAFRDFVHKQREEIEGLLSR